MSLPAEALLPFIFGGGSGGGDSSEVLRQAKQYTDEQVNAALDEAKEALLACFEKVAWKEGNGREYFDALAEALSGSETYSTVLYTDGRFIINEKGSKREENIALHGAVVAEYDPLDSLNTYVFTVDGSGNSSAPWASHKSDVTSVEIGSTIRPTDMKGWFAKFSNCTAFLLGKLNCSRVTSLRQLFRGCSSMQSINLDPFETTDNAVLKDMFGMFMECSAVTTLDLSMFNAQGVTSMYNTFNGCLALTSLLLPDLSTSSLTSIGCIFQDCQNLTSLDLSKFTANADSYMQVFYNCKKLTSIDISGFSTSVLYHTSSMFRGCSALTTILATSDFSVANVTNSNYMFRDSTNLVGGAGTTYNSSHLDKEYARIDGGVSAPGYFTAKA